jgi:poly-gamma-glutamate synthesis protein (capsule biosynthesis protein)
VVRHHSHAIQGAEVWKDVPIYYGLGNFYFPYGNPSASWRNGVILMVDVPSNRPALMSRMFVEFDDNGNLKGAAESKWCEKIFCDSSAAIADGDKLQAIWQGVVRRSSRFYLGSLYSSCDTIRRILVRLGVFGRMIPNRRQLLFLKNRISCETHAEVLEDVINQLMDDKGLR